MTALGFYMMVSLFMIVAALLEFAVVLIIKHGSQTVPSQSYRSENQTSTDYHKAESKTPNDSRNTDESDGRKGGWMERNEASKTEKPIHERIDRACFGIFPSLYVVFNAAYWASYII